ncbi:MAG: ABC transporter ATP-binding protein [Ruminococcus sp.]|nr:ABC transporter ATP-binding protein [Ruminococcus sp.]
MSNTAVISAAGLCAGYGKKIVVDGLSFSVGAGEILTLIGPNGAGKSTVIKTIAAQLPAVSGNVYIGQMSLRQMNERDVSRHLSLLLTSRLSTDKMTCEDVVSTGRYPYTGRLGILSENDRRIVQDAMELTSVLHLRERDFRHISDGQRQCVMLARAIAQQPGIMLLDEPTSFLDISNKLRLLTLLRRLVREKNIAVIQSLHELDLAQKFSDRLLCIHGGKAERLGTPEEIFSGGYISRLYGIDTGSYDTLYGTAEPERIKGEPEVFVIGGGGSGIPVYRSLQRQGIPFAAGVIHENDIDHPAAEKLASVLITEAAFEPISSDTLDRARAVMRKCGRVICCADTFGTMNMGNLTLRQEAEAEGKL